MYLFMHDMNDMLHTWKKKLNHTSLLMNAFFSLLNNIQIYCCDKKIELGLEKSNLFLRTKKSGFLMKEKLDMFLGNRKIGFFFSWKKNKIYFFISTKNMKKISWEEDFIHEINLCYMH